MRVFIDKLFFLFSPTVQKFGGSLDLNSVLGFVDSGRGLILAVDGSASELVREIATECGVDFDEDSRAVVIDHGSFANGDHMLIASDDFIDFMMSFWGRKNRSSCTIPRDWSCIQSC
ncbi:hypothetical protein IFM89_030304 [Coptis chinensis]|uniref:Dolichyl-diphosphooligosaccharide--protein glycosyltransferase 48 kDa subunit n=1 Tax=Coptis chinensis TaxID=261450 RepID=A0A835IU04_9MAGN|nr:hypothetical protein IFM89_030304 [Coptis chinensis]